MDPLRGTPHPALCSGQDQAFSPALIWTTHSPHDGPARRPLQSINPGIEEHMVTRTKDQPEELKGAVNRPNILRKFTQWRTIKTMVEAENKRLDNLRKWLLAAVEQEGEPDDKGSLYLPLPEPFDGFESLKAERRVTNTLNADKAEALIRSKGLFDQCTNLVLHVTDQEAAIEALRAAGLLEGQGFDVARELDEEAILRAHYEEHLTQADLDAIFDVKETYAFVPLKG